MKFNEPPIQNLPPAKDDKEKKLQKEVDELVANPEKVLREFVGRRLSDSEMLQGWEGGLQIRIRDRLAGKENKRYIFGIGQSARSLDKEKEKVVTAALVYELQHRGETEQGAYEKPALLFRMALKVPREGGLYERAVAKAVDAISLQEIFTEITTTKVKTPEDLPLIAHLAVERMAKGQELEMVKKIVVDVADDLFRRTKKSRLEPEIFFERAVSQGWNREFELRYSPEIMDLALEQIQISAPNAFKSAVISLRNKAERKDIPATEEAVMQKVKNISLDKWQERETLLRANNVRKTAQALIQSIPRIGEAVGEMRKQEEEQKEAEHQREQEVARQRDTELQKQQEAERIAKERRQEEISRRLKEQEQREEEQAQREFDEFLEELADYRISSEKFAFEVREKTVHIDEWELEKLWQKENWDVIQFGNSTLFMSIAEVERRFWRVLNALIDSADRGVLIRTWNKKREAWEKEITKVFGEHQGIIIKKIKERLTVWMTEDVDEELREEQIEKSIGKLQNEHWEQDEEAQKGIKEVVAILEELQEEVRKRIKKQERESAEIEQKESMATRKKEFCYAQIAQQTEYLKDLYELGTGLSLEEMSYHGSSTMGRTVGSVQMGMGMGMRLSLRQELRQELKIEIIAQNTMVLEMGDNIESILVSSF